MQSRVLGNAQNCFTNVPKIIRENVHTSVDPSLSGNWAQYHSQAADSTVAEDTNTVHGEDSLHELGVGQKSM